MRKILEGSLLYRLLTAAAGWIDRQWQKSLLSRLFTPPRRERGGTGVLAALARKAHRGLCRGFEAVRLDRALEGSVTQRAYFWVALAVFWGPILPTMAVLALALLAFGSLFLVYGKHREREAVHTPLTKWILLFAGVELGSTLLSVTVRESMRTGLLTAAFTLFALTVPDVCRERRALDKLLGLMAAAGTLVALGGLAQAVTGVEGNRVWIDTANFSDITLRVWSTLENPNVLSEYLLLIIPLAAAGVYTAESRRGKIAYGLGAAAMLLCLVLTWSRGGWLGLAIGAALFLVLMDRRFIPLGLLGAVGLLAILPDSIMTRLLSVGNMADSSTSYRVYIWMACLNMLKDYWLSGFGTGVAAFQAVYPHYSFNAVFAPHSHNLFLQTFCENGILGILALLGSFCSAALCLGRTLTAAKDKRTKVQAAALMASVAGFAAQSMTDHSFYNFRVELMFWTVVGAAAALYALVTKEARE